jgi:hypothetical protein
MTPTFIELHRIDGDGNARQLLVRVDQILTIEPGAEIACITLTDRTSFWTRESAREIADRLRSVGCRVAFFEVQSCLGQL